MSVSSIDELQQSMTPSKRMAILIGSIFLMLTVSAFGLSLTTIQQPILDRMGASDMFSLVVVLSSLALCLMTPVGGSLTDMFGSKNVVLVSGVLVILSSIILGFCTKFIPFLIMRILLSVGMGAFISLPFLLVREIFPIRDVPKMMGLLTAALAGGGLIGSFFAGLFLDNGLYFLAICFPSVFLVIGVPLIYFNIPNKKINREPFDFVGLILLSVCLFCIFMSLNNGPKLGWDDLSVLGGLAIGICFLAGFILYEKRCPHPLIPMQLFANKQFAVILIIGFLSFFYLNAMNAYAPLAVQTVMDQSTSVSGTIQLPRTIVTLILPFIFGAWIVKKPNRYWKAMAYAMFLISVPFIGLVFIGPAMPVWFVMAMLAVNGIGESYRAVSLTPAAQALLEPQDLGIGTALMSFVTSLAGVFSGSVYGMVYDGLSAATPGTRGMIDGLDTVFLIAAATGLIGFLLVVFVYRPLANKAYQRKLAASQKE